MENSFQTSFIPKKPIVANSSASNSDNSISITMVVSIFILVVMLAATGGLYLYKNYLQNNKAVLSGNLKKIKDSFDKNTIANLETYDKTSSVAKQILENHIVLSPLFELINELTLSSIQYTKFDHKVVNGVFSVNMSGIARDYKSIALQADVFSTPKGRMFQNVIFSNLTKDKNNNVTFNVEFDVDRALLSYSNNITNGNIKTSANNTPSIDQPAQQVTNNPQ
ncbi:MAG: hypothetical protein WCI91_00165 [Candidatus Nomurabacteria bacterium]